MTVLYPLSRLSSAYGATIQFPVVHPPGLPIAAGAQYFALWLANETNIGNNCGFVIQRFVYDATNALVFSDNFLIFTGGCVVGQWFFIPVSAWNDGTHTIFLNIGPSGGGFQQNWFDTLLQDDQGALEPIGTPSACCHDAMLDAILAAVRKTY